MEGRFAWHFAENAEASQKAVNWLEKGYEERDDLMINLKVEPVLDSLHSDPRFQDLVRRVRIPQ
jgi:hypothetical protein